MSGFFQWNSSTISTFQPPKSAKPTPEKKSTPSKAKLAAMKKKADAARRKAQRDAKKLAELGEKDGDEEEEEMPRLEKSTISPPIGLSPDPHFPHSQNPFFFGEPVDILTLKPWLADPQTLYPLDLVPIEEDVPGRVWCPPRGLCQATAEQVCEIGPLTELETLDLTLCPEAFTHLVPEKADMIIRRMLELQIPYLEMKMLNPEMTDEDREMNIKQLEVYEKQLDENHDKPALLRMRILNLPGPPIQRIPSYRESIEYYSELDPTWYSSSRVWFDKAIRKSGKVTQQDFLDQFEETDDQMILDFQREMLAKAKEAEEQQAADKIKNFKMPLVHSIENMTPVVQERMLAFRDKLAHIFQYEDFEEIHMSDPSCRGIWKKLQPLPYEHGVQADEAEEELIALISAFKIQFAEENPIIPLPEAYDDENETPSEIEAATKRFLSDVIDTVVLREVTDIVSAETGCYKIRTTFRPPFLTGYQSTNHILQGLDHLVW